MSVLIIGIICLSLPKRLTIKNFVSNSCKATFYSKKGKINQKQIEWRFQLSFTEQSVLNAPMAVEIELQLVIAVEEIVFVNFIDGKRRRANRPRGPQSTESYRQVLLSRVLLGTSLQHQHHPHVQQGANEKNRYLQQQVLEKQKIVKQFREQAVFAIR